MTYFHDDFSWHLMSKHLHMSPLKFFMITLYRIICCHDNICHVIWYHDSNVTPYVIVKQVWFPRSITSLYATFNFHDICCLTYIYVMIYVILKTNFKNANSIREVPTLRHQYVTIWKFMYLFLCSLQRISHYTECSLYQNYCI